MPSSPVTPASAGNARPRPTMEDVAGAAGVARMTVSRVLNRPDTVAPGTIAAVQAAIEALGYVPNVNAASLASNKSHIIGAVIPTISSEFFSDTISGLSQTLAAKGYQLLLGQTLYDAKEEAALIDAFVGRRVDGMVLIRTSTPEALALRIQRSGIPFLEAWDISNEQIDMLVGFSHKEAGKAAAFYLASKGHCHLGYIGSTEARSSARLAGFRNGAKALGLPDVAAVTLSRPAAISDARSTFAGLLEMCPEVEAVFCSSDMLAAGVLFECQRRGLAVPGKIAVMGFADLPVAAETCPAITTVRVPSHEIGKRAGEMLLARLEGKKNAIERLDLGFELIERGSA